MYQIYVGNHVIQHMLRVNRYWLLCHFRSVAQAYCLSTQRQVRRLSASFLSYNNPGCFC